MSIKIAHSYGVKIRFKKLNNIAGWADFDNEIIYIEPFLKKTIIGAKYSYNEYILSTIFHEIGHIVAKRNGKFKTYHYSNRKVFTKKILNSLLKTAFRAEKYVDIWGEKEMKRAFPELKYVKSYRNNVDKKWILNYWHQVFGY